jgi:N-acetyl-anhydromuramyl-L-alanine amidase AmpD
MTNWKSAIYKQLAREAVEKYGKELKGILPKDAAFYGYDGKDHVTFFSELLGALAVFESGQKTDVTYKENFKDRKGNFIISRGLLQLSIESSNAYGAGLKNENELHDAATNLRCGVLIMKRWILKDNIIAAREDGAWKGMARYWSPFRKTDRVLSIQKSMKKLSTPRVLKLGDTGSDVTEIFVALNVAGFKVYGMGNMFDKEMDSQVRAFQKANKLTVDGKVGPQTRMALGTIKPEPRENKDGDIVKEIPKNIYKPVIPDLTPVKGKHIFPRVTRVDLDPDRGGAMKSVEGIVWHYTVSFHAEATVEYFKRNVVDVHFVVGHKGEVIQMVEGNRKAAHAGTSSWGKLKSLNDYFIGIEFVNMGPLYPFILKNPKGPNTDELKFLDYYENQKMKAGKKYKFWEGEVIDCMMHGHRYWEPLSAAQLQVGKEITLWAMKTYGFSTKNVVSHAEIAPGRKIDIGGSLGKSMNELRKEMDVWLKQG